jgi:HEAT repeat protein
LALKNDNWRIRNNTAEALGQMGEKGIAAITALIEVLKDKDNDVCSSAAWALGKMGMEGKAAIPALIEALKHKDSGVRKYAAWALGKMGAEGKAALPNAMQTSKSELLSPSHAVYLIDNQTNQPFDAIDIQINPTFDNNVDLSFEGDLLNHNHTNNTKNKIATKDKLSIPALVEKLKHTDAAVRSEAAEALRQRDSEAKAAIPALIEALIDTNRIVRKHAALALGKMGIKDGLPVMIQALKYHVRMDKTFCHTTETLIQMGAVAIPTLLQALNDKSMATRLLVAKTLGKMGVKNGIPILIQALNVMDRDVHELAVSGLIKIGAAAIPALIEALKDKDNQIRISAAWALGSIGETAKAAIPALIEALKDHNSRFRAIAGEALGAIGGEAKAAIPALMEALKDKDRIVRRSAAEALKRISTSSQPATSVPAASRPTSNPTNR